MFVLLYFTACLLSLLELLNLFVNLSFSIILILIYFINEEAEMNYFDL